MLKTDTDTIQITVGPLLIGLRAYHDDNVWKITRKHGFLHIYAYRGSMTLKWGYTPEDLAL